MSCHCCNILPAGSCYNDGMSFPENRQHESSRLWQQLSELEITPPEQAWTFEARLAKENGWGLDRALAVVGEYKKFLFLVLTSQHPVTPSEDVDAAWHLHLLYTRSYWDVLCAKIAQRPIHHVPTAGGSHDDDKYRRQYAETLERYTEVFGVVPPRDIWPSVAERFSSSRNARWVDASEYYLVPRPWRWLTKRLFLARPIKKKGDVHGT